MGLATVQKEILETVQNTAEGKIARAIEKSSELRKETDEKVNIEKVKSREETEKLIQHIKDIRTASAKFEIKKIELNSKKNIINKTFSIAEEKIRKLDDEKLEKLIGKLLKNAQDEMNVKYIYCNEKTARWVPKHFIVKTAPMLGGIIAENHDMTLRVDNSFETILEDIRKDALAKIARRIF